MKNFTVRLRSNSVFTSAICYISSNKENLNVDQVLRSKRSNVVFLFDVSVSTRNPFRKDTTIDIRKIGITFSGNLWRSTPVHDQKTKQYTGLPKKKQCPGNCSWSTILQKYYSACCITFDKNAKTEKELESSAYRNTWHFPRSLTRESQICYQRNAIQTLLFNPVLLQQLFSNNDLYTLKTPLPLPAPSPSYTSRTFLRERQSATKQHASILFQ